MIHNNIQFVYSLLPGDTQLPMAELRYSSLEPHHLKITYSSPISFSLLLLVSDKLFFPLGPEEGPSMPCKQNRRSSAGLSPCCCILSSCSLCYLLSSNRTTVSSLKLLNLAGSSSCSVWTYCLVVLGRPSFKQISSAPLVSPTQPMFNCSSNTTLA